MAELKKPIRRKRKYNLVAILLGTDRYVNKHILSLTKTSINHKPQKRVYHEKALFINH